MVFILFIGTCIVSSSDVKLEEKTPFNKNIESIFEFEEKINDGKIAYAYNAYPGPECTVTFPLDDPSDIEKCGDTISGDFLSGGTMVTDELWYGVQYSNGLLYGIDPDNCDMWSIGGGGSNGDIAWDDWTEKLYFSTMAGLAFNNEGVCYGINFDGSDCNLYIIEFKPYEHPTLIGPLINFTYEWGLIDAEFDKDTNILYIVCPNGLYTCDTDTRECTFVGSTGGIELSALAIPYEEYETTPFTEITFDPPIPDGENDWYVSDVNVTLNPIGFVYGVDATYYRINGAEWYTYDSPFVISEEGDDILIEYYSVDNNGTTEDIKSATINIDKTAPNLDITWEIIGGNPIDGWYLVFTVNVTDNYSSMDRVEFYLNNELQETVSGPGPIYIWGLLLHSLNSLQVNGLIYNREITENNVSFNSIFVKASEIQGTTYILKVCTYDNAGNMECNETILKRPNPIEPGLYLFKRLTLPNNYSGYIGRLLIFAKF
jgi:hypothetical protein